MATVETTSLIVDQIGVDQIGVDQIGVDQIGETAGEVWHTLLEHGQLTMTQLAKRVDAPRDRVMQAVGWLAREEKICIDEQARRKVISLN